VGLADLLERRVGDDHHYHVAELDGLRDRAHLGERPETCGEWLDVLRMARREHHRVPGFDEQGAKGTAHASGPDRADLERRSARGLGPRGSRPGDEGSRAKPASRKLEKAAAVVISGVYSCHIPLLVQVHATLSPSYAQVFGVADR
jgi:hypothetical protein